MSTMEPTWVDILNDSNADLTESANDLRFQIDNGTLAKRSFPGPCGNPRVDEPVVPIC